MLEKLLKIYISFNKCLHNLDDLEFSTNTKPGYLCYVTKWDISDAEWNSPVIIWDKNNCFQLLDEHFCTNFTTNVAVPGDCSVNISKTIPITAGEITINTQKEKYLKG